MVVTAGGTREAIDPVRFIGNHSRRQGFALADVAAQRGADVTRRRPSTLDAARRDGAPITPRATCPTRWPRRPRAPTW